MHARPSITFRNPHNIDTSRQLVLSISSSGGGKPRVFPDASPVALAQAPAAQVS
jgi:hypothetical protein